MAIVCIVCIVCKKTKLLNSKFYQILLKRKVMRNKSIESRSVISYRSKPSCHARLIQSSQIPKDFFSGH